MVKWNLDVPSIFSGVMYSSWILFNLTVAYHETMVKKIPMFIPYIWISLVVRLERRFKTAHFWTMFEVGGLRWIPSLWHLFCPLMRWFVSWRRWRSQSFGWIWRICTCCFMILYMLMQMPTDVASNETGLVYHIDSWCAILLLSLIDLWLMTVYENKFLGIFYNLLIICMYVHSE